MRLTRPLIVLALVAAAFLTWHELVQAPRSAGEKQRATAAVTASPVAPAPTALPRPDRSSNHTPVAGPATPRPTTPLRRPTPRAAHRQQRHSRRAITRVTTPTFSANPRPATRLPAQGTDQPAAATTAQPAATAAPPPVQAATATAVVPTATPAPQPALASFDPNVPSATIVIPRLGVQAPVYDRGLDSTRNLPIAPGYAVTHYHFSAVLGQPGNYVIYGHDDIEGQIFRYLPTMRVGDLVYLSSQGHRYTYRVTGSSVVSPDDVAVMAPTSNATLTMISCTPYWVDTQRIIVKATLV